MGRRGENGRRPKLLRGQEWITTIECISASGCALPPLVIYSATGAMNIRWIPEGGTGTEKWSWTTSNKGWTNDTLSYDWLQDIFEPSTASPSDPSSPSNRRLLIVDGHGSHVKARFLLFCVDHAIDLMVLPAHTSAITQPLDVGVFGPLKAHMARLTDRGATLTMDG